MSESKQPTPEEQQKRENAEAVEELDRAISRCCGAGILREYEIKLPIEAARTLRSYIDDLDTAAKQCEMAEEAYRQCDTKLKDVLVEVEALRAWKKQALTVERWWTYVDAEVRKHPSVLLGSIVAAEAIRLIEEHAAMAKSELRGELTNVGTMRVAHEEDRTGFFVGCPPEQIKAIKHLPMYRRVAIVVIP